MSLKRRICFIAKYVFGLSSFCNDSNGSRPSFSYFNSYLRDFLRKLYDNGILDLEDLKRVVKKDPVLTPVLEEVEGEING